MNRDQQQTPASCVRSKKFIVSPTKRTAGRILVKGSGTDPLLQAQEDDEEPDEENETDPKSGPGPSGGVVIYYSPTTDPTTGTNNESPVTSPAASSATASPASNVVTGTGDESPNSQTPVKTGSRNNNDMIISSCSQLVDYEISV